MALNKADLFALVNANIADNTTKAITPQKHREVATQTIDSALNTQEDTAQSVTGEVNFTGGLKKSGSNVAIGAVEVEVLRAYSLALTQAPTAVSVPLKIEFGAAQKTVNDPVMIDELGNVTFNQAGTYAVRIKLQMGRAGASGTSFLAARILKNNVQVGVSACAKLTSADFSYPAESKVTLSGIIPGDVFHVEIMRDPTGANFGGVLGFAVANGWNIAPCALLVVTKLEPIL